MKRIGLVILLFMGGVAQAKPLIAHCNVEEFSGSGAQTRVQSFRFDGSLQTPAVELQVFKDMKVELKGAPGAVDDHQAFYLMIKITDLNSGHKSIAEAYFLTKRKYSEKFEKVIPGSLDASLSQPNGDKIKVICFNPRNGAR